MATDWEIKAGPNRSAYLVYSRHTGEMVGHVWKVGKEWHGKVRGRSLVSYSTRRVAAADKVWDEYKRTVLSVASRMLNQRVVLEESPE